ncbi:hypothetical protein MSG28_001612 [Choristoneura fumiferana]|uniref:Uncharacterized protein n=1 Tax=Choristoneura fumiferana TaxID=7141 RepID=A0ACC0KUU1_CHOFU|nr:hypothetical protein MSG28_001612 [Choristoneura fumiferana]
MPNTRKKVIKTVYKDEDESEEENKDFSDSGSDAEITEQSSSEDELDNHADSSGEEFKEDEPKSSSTKKRIARKKPQFAKSFINRIRNAPQYDTNESDAAAPAISVKDLTDADKQLPSFLNLSESDSSDDEAPKKPSVQATSTSFTLANELDSDNETKMEYQDVWSKNIPDNSEEIAQNTFKELEIHKIKIEETKASILKYTARSSNEGAFDVKDLLAQGEVLPDPVPVVTKKRAKKKGQNDSDSELEDWEEVKESKALPASGLQVVVDFPDAVARKTKKLDIEMMMKRKMNRVKKEYQVYMHKVHVLCWLGHGNYVSSVINDQEIMSAVLSLVPSKECYPGQRVDVKYVEQITKWFNNKLSLKQDKNEHKFKPKAPPLKDIMLKEIKSKVVSTKKYMFFIFVSMLRALGLQCRVMFNFVTLPIKPPSSELCSLSTKVKDEKKGDKKENSKNNAKKDGKKNQKTKIPQVDGNYDSDDNNSNVMEVDVIAHWDIHIMQVDGNDDSIDTVQKGRKSRLTRARTTVDKAVEVNEEVSPPKRARKSHDCKVSTSVENKNTTVTRNRNNEDFSKSQEPKAKSDPNSQVSASPRLSLNRQRKTARKDTEDKFTEKSETKPNSRPVKKATDSTIKSQEVPKKKIGLAQIEHKNPDIVVTNEKNKTVSSLFFENDSKTKERTKPTKRTRSQTTTNLKSTQNSKSCEDKAAAKTRSKSASTAEKSKYFEKTKKSPVKKSKIPPKGKRDPEDQLRVSHRDITAKTKAKATLNNDVTDVLINLVQSRMSQETPNKLKPARGKPEKGKEKDGSDYDPEAEVSDEDFKPTKISPKPSTSRKIDRRVISSEDETPKDKTDVWCEVFVEELEQWIAVDVNRATHPVCYVVGWDNNNYLKDLTRRYVPQWNTVTRKQRAEPSWWDQALALWRGPRTARDKEEDEQLDRMQLDAPLPKSITEYKNHPLYALKRHLLKFEALYPPDAAVLGFVRNEPVYARECVYICRSRDVWLKEAKVVRLGEKPYKIVTARPKWDRLSNKCIKDKPLEIFGPWQVQDYEPPVAENGIVPRNAYGNVELFKDCMLPKGTAHIKLPGLNKVAKKLNIDCAPAMTGFDFNGGWSHPVYDGFVVCKEFEEIITEAWLKDQEDQERREREKTEARVYGHWKKLIRGLMIKERLKLKYGFEEPTTSENTKKSKGPRLVVKKK